MLAGQLADIRVLRDDAQTRGWDTEVDRHTHVMTKLEQHLATLERATHP